MPIEQTVSESQVNPALLRQDIRLLGEYLGNTLKEQVSDSTFEQVERIRQLAKAETTDDKDPKDWNALIDLLTKLPTEELVPITRAFAQFLQYANIAEQHHRARHVEAASDLPDAEVHANSLRKTIDELKNAGLSNDKLIETINNMNIELVLTAHPTETTRRSIIRKHSDIQTILTLLDQPLPQKERAAQLRRLNRRIQAAWQTDEIRRERPTPVDEAKWGFATIETTLWDTVPDFLRDVNNLLEAKTGQSLPLTSSPIKFSSWMGGDRDGNPNVTSVVTEEVLLLARWQAAYLFYKDINELRADLTMHTANAFLTEATNNHPEPYREYLRPLREKLKNTRDWCQAQLDGEHFDTAKYPIMQSTEEFLQPLLHVHDSLAELNMHAIANGSLVNIIRRAATFGIHLLRLDIRQESTRHSDVIAALVEQLEIRTSQGPYDTWTEIEKQHFLIQELNSPRPLIPHHFTASPEVDEVIRTFNALAKQPAEALGAYIISMARQPSDVLAVRLLQKEAASRAGTNYKQRIVPLFETLDDLNNAESTMEQLYDVDWYRQDIGQEQEVMIGYSDSAKDAGFFAAAWAQYQAQEKLSELSKGRGIDLTLFHGRGGTVSRGGGPAQAAILTLPPGSVNGRIRITEQGEVIQFKFGIPALALHNLELYLSSTLKATIAPSGKPKAEWRKMMDTLSKDCSEVYRGLVRHNPNFVTYFRQVTPEQELGRLALGSRPAKRRASGGIESLRAIPWVFAWTQSRLMLPAWYGSSQALDKQIKEGNGDTIKTMLQDWTYFHTLINMQEMVLAKADPQLFSYYQHRLLEDESLKDFGESLIAALKEAYGVIQGLQDHEILATTPFLASSIRTREPYIRPLHVIQAELMRRLRELERTESYDETAYKQIERALMVAITGIAAGIRNTG
ncbi:MAG: phosphoenolpyruvate carboxylase [Pseudomonadota bacterium]|nr:phosphoenolpyruvate carboxylase [Gammaproteobacteria bacterium]MEC8012263.1 phosphoenolpyruvate carboxylase [Pseudomonadota bacterium]|tara:strand:- start:3808 stop:6534 length:2727 start_codon:yes stop_codon:yes gene_type:complete